MGWWDAKAQRLQIGVRIDEGATKGVIYHDGDDVRRAVVHTREDVVMIYSQLSSLNAQISSIKWILLVATALLAYAVFR